MSSTPENKVGLTEEERNKIADMLNSKNAKKPCARCGNSSFLVLDGYVALPLQSNVNTFALGPKNIPCAVVACTNCGDICLHALGAINLLPKPSPIVKTDDSAI